MVHLQEVQINSLVDHIYNDFLGKVAAGRRKSREEIRALAKGRVYTGQQALAIGLVDELGGLREAIALAKVSAGLPQGQEVREYDREGLTWGLPWTMYLNVFRPHYRITLTVDDSVCVCV